jgi:hypothetical protein
MQQPGTAACASGGTACQVRNYHWQGMRCTTWALVPAHQLLPCQFRGHQETCTVATPPQ